MNGALLIDKPAGISSFGVIEALQKELRRRTGLKKRDLPKMGHGGTLDPFATGLLVVCFGEGAKLARYFLGSKKTYEGVFRFGETTASGDPTNPITERSPNIPKSLAEISAAADSFLNTPYNQIPPMHSAVKIEGKRLYELARAGIEVERSAKICEISQFEVSNYFLDSEDQIARTGFHVVCSSGTYVRVLAKDLATKLGTVGMLDSLRRIASGSFRIDQSTPLADLLSCDDWEKLSSFIPFHKMLTDMPRVNLTASEVKSVRQGQQQILHSILRSFSSQNRIALYHETNLTAVAVQVDGQWSLERVFTVITNIS